MDITYIQYQGITYTYKQIYSGPSINQQSRNMDFLRLINIFIYLNFLIGTHLFPCLL